MKKLGWTLLILVTMAMLLAYYMYYKPVDSLLHTNSVAFLSADSIFKLYEENEQKANELYLDKVITVTGKVQSLMSDTSGVSIALLTSSGMFGVNCKLEDKEVDETLFPVGRVVQLKGVCSGYLMDVVLIRCVKVEE